MNDLSSILLLLPPNPPQRLPRAPGASTPGATDLAVNVDAAAGGDSARARRFRFRVHEGEGADETSTRYDGARVGAGRLSLASNGSVDADRAGRSDRRSRNGAAFTNDASSAFLAQTIAQEQLGEGLHNPPNRAAAIAYTRSATALTPRASAGVDLHA